MYGRCCVRGRLAGGGKDGDNASAKPHWVREGGRCARGRALCRASARRREGTQEFKEAKKEPMLSWRVKGRQTRQGPWKKRAHSFREGQLAVQGAGAAGQGRQS